MENTRQKNIRIAMVAPPFGETGGPEVVAKNLAQSLYELGCNITLFAPADWKTSVPLVPTLPRSLWNTGDFLQRTDDEKRNMRIASQLEVLAYEEDFDIIHVHSQKYASLVGKAAKKPCVVTFHNKIVQAEFDEIRNSGMYTVALSNAHKKDFRVSAVIGNGMPVKDIRPSFEKGNYLIMIGRITYPKGVDIAIEIAKKAGKKLLIFGRVGSSPERQEYFRLVQSLCDEDIIYKGEASREEIFEYLRDAEALLFTTRAATGGVKVCPLVVMEALACGTPVIGTPIDIRHEDLKNPVVSCFSDDIETLAEAARNTNTFDRKLCRSVAEEHFDSTVMAKKYLQLYEDIIYNNCA